MLIELSKIRIPERARRVDTESPEFQELVQSIRTHGLLTPITVRKIFTEIDGISTHIYQLVCGARRLTAFKHLLVEDNVAKYRRIQANCVRITSNTEHLICELEENIRRKDFTWQEQVLASGKLFQAILETDKEVNCEKFAQLLQQSRAKAYHDMDMYDNRLEHPTIFACETWSRAREELRRLKVAKLAAEKIRRARASRPTEVSPEVYETESSAEELGGTLLPSSVLTAPSALDMVKESALLLLESLKDNSVDVICTDPPFFIDIQGGRHRRTQEKIYKEDQKDKREDIFKILAPCIPHFARVLKPGAHLYMFFGIEHLSLLKNLLEQSGFLVHKVPLIWHRTGAGAAANQPYYLPGSAYQTIMFAFAPGERRRLQKQGESNVITLPALPSQKKIHPLEIPVHIYADLIQRSVCPGDLIIDPFCGTGNSLVAGLWSNCRVLGAEIREDYRNLAVLNVEERLAFIEELKKSREGKK